MVSVGQTAPDFAGSAVHEGEGRMLELFALVREHDAVALVFEPADFVPTCTAEFAAIRDAGWHAHPSLAVVGLTGDSLFSHAAYADQYDLPFPLVSDFHGGIADSYDLVLDEWEGHSRIPARATVVVDGDWEVRAVESVSPLSAGSPAPVERVTDALHEAGVDVERPDVSPP
jgi:peroxiredoxin